MKKREIIRSDKKDARKIDVKRHPVFGALKGTVRIAAGVDLTEPAEPEWEKLFLEANEWWIDLPKPPNSKG